MCEREDGVERFAYGDIMDWVCLFSGGLLSAILAWTAYLFIACMHGISIFWRWWGWLRDLTFKESLV